MRLFTHFRNILLIVVLFMLSTAELCPPDPGNISGKISDERFAVNDAVVKLYQSGQYSQSTRSSTTGDFRFSGIEPGLYHITVAKQNYETKRYPSSGSFNVGEGRTYRAEVTLSGLCGVTVTAPKKGDVLANGSNATIAWSTRSAGSLITIDLYKNSSKICSIKTGVQNTGLYSWTVDDCNGGEASDYKIRVTNLDDPSCYGESGAFKIEDHAVRPPDRPSGPPTLCANFPGTYIVMTFKCSQDHAVEFQFDWGDGRSSPWGGRSRDNSWSQSGTYCVKMRARCTQNTDVESNWSQCQNVNVGTEAVSMPDDVTGLPFIGPHK